MRRHGGNRPHHRRTTPASLRELASDISGKNTPAEVLGAAERSWANRKDLPCTLLYLFNEDGIAALAALDRRRSRRSDRAGDRRSLGRIRSGRPARFFAASRPD